MRWMHYRFIYFAVSAVVIAAGVFGLLRWGLNLGVDFKGGSILEYRIPAESIEEIKKGAGERGINIESVQKTGDSYIFRTNTITFEQSQQFLTIAKAATKDAAIELRFETVGPSIGPDLIRKTVYALLISAGAILLWVAYQFKSIKFGASAVLAMFHDSLVLIGSFALLGHFFGASIDFLFVTALLTILSFSVHDTIVVYDRIRETHKKQGGTLGEIADVAITQTMTRSLNNSMTIVFMLIALVLMGGESIKWFAVALLIGTISGTYSSPFVSVPILVTWDELVSKYWVRLSKRS